MDLEGKVALVTGAARRVGAEIARALARRGVAVAVHYRSSEGDARALVAEIQAAGGRAVALRADVTRAADVDALVAGTEEALGGLDLLVNNAGRFVRTPFPRVTESEWDASVDANLKGPFLCCRAAAPGMIARGGGKIVNIADVAGVRPWAEYVPYSVAKAGLIALTIGLAKELAPTVLVNAVAPGAVLLEGLSEDIARRQIARVPLRRAGAPEDVAAAVVYLAENDYVTGVCLPVDGGRLAV